MADETSLETHVTDAAAACAEEIANDEGWEDASDLTLTKLVIARHMRELLVVATTSEFFDASAAALVARLRADVTARRDELSRIRQACAKSNDTICQTLAQALGGFAWYKDDQDHFPGATEANGVMVIEHTAEDLAELAAKRISELSARIRTMRTLGGLIDVYGSSMWNQGYTAAERGPITRTAEDAKAKINAILDGKPAAGDATMTLLPALKECELFLRVYGLDHPEIAELAANCRDVIAKATTEGGVS
jgi:hypothetical protein